MTHRIKTCLLIIFLLMIITWGGPLQASQGQHGEMTDGNFFIHNQVLGGGAIFTGSEPYTPVGTVGQILSNIGVFDADGVTQKAGFWHAITGTNDTLLSFTRSLVHIIDESDAQRITATLGLALSKPTEGPITVTIATSRSACVGDSADYTLYKNNIPQNSSTVTVIMNGQRNEELTVDIINDRDIEKNDEIITFYIANIQGDVKKGLFPEYEILIPANDAWPITGTVKYLGSQTGNLVAFARELTTGDEYPVVSEWNTETTSDTFTLEVPPGSYTICAFIDSDGAGTMVQNDWEVKGSYTISTLLVEEDGEIVPNNFTIATIAMYDPTDRYASQFIEKTGPYESWFNSFPKLLAPDENGIYRDDPDDDWDQDGYTNFQEYLNGTDPTIVDEAYTYNGYDIASDRDAAEVATKYQIVSTNPIVPKADFDKDFLVDINYTTSDKNRGATGLGLAIHFNSTFMDFAGISNPLTETLAGNYKELTNIHVKDETEVDAPDDGFEDTDKVILIAWVSDLEGRSWPGMEIPLPLRLCTLKFSVKSEAHGITYGDTSVLRFSATSKDARYTFYASPTTIELDPFSFDVDGNGKANALTDGLLIMRYLFGLIIYDEEYPNALETAIATDAIRKTSNEIWTYLNNGRETLDIDRNDDEDALTDALLIMRYMFDLDEGQSLIENAIGEGAKNDTAEKVIPYIKHYLPQKYSPVITPATE